MNVPYRLWGSAAEELVTYIGHILRSTTTVAFWGGGVVVGPGQMGPGKIYFAIYSVCNYSLVRRRIPSIPLRVECNINFGLEVLSSASLHVKILLFIVHRASSDEARCDFGHI